jgi:ubiquinone/menaquinone biosynthesis C-methylase UbiE
MRSQPKIRRSHSKVPSPAPVSKSRRSRSSAKDGWHGWDEYAEFYDWENARTMRKRDIAFWQAFVRRSAGPVLELGCGTGRVTAPLGRTGLCVVGVDRSENMLRRARRQLHRGAATSLAQLVRADIVELPFISGSFAGVVAPYGILQSLLSDRLLAATLNTVARVLRPGGLFGLEMVPDVPHWQETQRKVSLVSLAGPNGKPVKLIESVHQDRTRHVTTFDHEFVEGTGSARRTLRFTIQFRTLRVRAMIRRLERAGLRIDGVFGGYRGEPWTEDATAWIIVARKPF